MKMPFQSHISLKSCDLLAKASAEVNILLAKTSSEVNILKLSRVCRLLQFMNETLKLLYVINFGKVNS